jgi:hypothetical protein
MEKVKTAQVIYAVDMVGVGVGEEDRVDPPKALTQRLEAKIRRGVEQYVPAVMAYQEGSPRPLVPRVIR